MKEMVLDTIAKIKKRVMGKCAVLATGNTPDGTLHLGALREQLIADAIFRMIGKEAPIEHYFFVYDYDGLKASNANTQLEKFIGTPLIEIPCSDEGCQSFAARNIEPFISSLNDLGIKHITIRTSDLYLNGALNPFIEEAYEKSLLVNKILGREVHSSPFIPLCHSCGKYCYNATLNSTVKCTNCGLEFKLDIKGPGKLRWELEWASIWKLFDIAIEPIGPIHTSQKGKSFENAVDIAEVIYRYLPPEPISFQTVNIFDIGCSFSKEAQCCRRNVKLTYEEWEKVAPPELLRYIMLRRDVEEPITVDIKRCLPQYYKDLETYLNNYNSVKENDVSLYDLIKVEDNLDHYCKVSFDDILNLIGKPELLPLRDTGFCGANLDFLKAAPYAKNYLRTYEIKEVPKITLEARLGLLCNNEKSILSYLLKGIARGEEIINSCKTAAIFFGIEKKKIFRFLYWVVHGETNGPPISKIFNDGVLSRLKSFLILT